MLTFIQYINLQEDRKSFILQTHQGDNALDTSHDSIVNYYTYPNLTKQELSDEIIKDIHTADPAHNKQHMQWVVNLYKKKNIRHEDLGRVATALEHFQKPAVRAALKTAGKPTDINQYKSLSDLEDAVEPHKEAISGKEEEKKIKSEGADLIHSGNGVTIHHIKTKEAACAYGAGTKWCTAGEKNNMFDHYNKRGPIFVIQHQGRKYQLHTHSNQFMDEKDKPTDISKVHPDIQKEMAKSDNPEVQKANLLFKNPHIKPEHFSKALNDEDASVREAAIEHPKATPEHITKALNVENASVRGAAIRNPNATPEHITKALDDEDDSVRRHAIIHPNVTPEHITKALDDEDWQVREAAIEHPKATPEHITKALNDKDAGVRGLAIKHPKATPEHITKALNDKNWQVRGTAIKHPKATPEHISKALNDKDASVRGLARLVQKRK